jgi:hypothetical protein
VGLCADALVAPRRAPQSAYASRVLNESQFAELESLQTPDAMNFVAEGAGCGRQQKRVADPAARVGG